MKNILILGFLIVLLVLAQYSKAQTVDEVIVKYTDALGEKDKLAAITSVSMTGISERNGNEIITQITKVQDKLYRSDVNFGMGTMATIVTADKGWRQNPRNGGAFEPMTDEQLKAQQYQMDCVSPLVDYASKGHKAALIGKETVDGIECWKIKLTSNGGKEISYWIDAKTNLLYQSSQKSSMGRGGETEITTVFKDYKAVEGVQFPFSTEIKTTGGQGFGGGTVVYEKIEVNKPVDEKLYKAE